VETGGRSSAAAGSMVASQILQDNCASYYDSDPVPLEEILKDRDLEEPRDSYAVTEAEDKAMALVCQRQENLSRAQLRALARAEAKAIAQAEARPSEETALSKRETEAMMRQYRPWFHTKFAKAAVVLPKTICMSDLQQILLEEGKKTMKPRGNTAISKPVKPAPAPKGRQSKTPSDNGSSASSSEAEEEQEQVWVGCDDCSKWRRVPPGVEINVDDKFVCTMLPGMTCEVAEEEWDEEDEWVEPEAESENNEQSQPCSDRRRKRDPMVSSLASSASESGKDKKRKAADEGHDRRAKKSSLSGKDANRNAATDVVEPQSPEDITAGTTLYSPTGKSANMSRLEAVIHVLGITKKPTHYDALTRQALRMGLIRFTGSQGTAGESMKAFLNKTIRENKSTIVINLGKGVYGLREWLTNGILSTNKAKPTSLQGRHAAGGSNTEWQSRSEQQSHDRVPPISPTGTTEILSRRSPRQAKEHLIGPSESQLNSEPRRSGMDRLKDKFGSLQGCEDLKSLMQSVAKGKLGINSLLN